MRPHKWIIAGSRRFPDFGITKKEHWRQLHTQIRFLEEIDQLCKNRIRPGDIIYSGHSWGIDALGEEWACINGYNIVLFPAEWKKYGKAAGPRRNGVMAKKADGLFCVYAPGSRGSMNMIDAMLYYGKPVFSREITI